MRSCLNRIVPRYLSIRLKIKGTHIFLLEKVHARIFLSPKDDHEMLKRGIAVYDAFYRWCKEGQDETYTWNPDVYR
jgi:hypothetical protein